MDLMKIGRFLQDLRREKGITQEELAEKVGVARRTVSRWEMKNILCWEITEITVRTADLRMSEIFRRALLWERFGSLFLRCLHSDS